MSSLLDPEILEGMYSETLLSECIDALRLAENEAGMMDFCLGEESAQHVYEKVGELGWPNAKADFLDGSLNRDINSLFGRIIGKAPIVESLQGGTLQSARATGGCSACADALGPDIAGGAVSGIESFLTLGLLWRYDEDRVTSVAEDLKAEIPRIDLDTYEVKARENSDFLCQFLKSKSIVIYGGKIVEDVYESLARYGVDRSNVNWIESELGKPPRDPARHLPSSSSNELIILILGFMGHSTSGVLKKAISDRGLTKLEVYKPRHIISELLAYRAYFEERNGS